MPRDGLYRRGRCWYFKVKGFDGVWVEQASRTHDYNQAKTIRAAALAQRDAGALPNERSRFTLTHAIELWLIERKPRITRGSYASELAITRRLCEVLGSRTVLIKLADVQVVRRYETTRLSAGINPKTVNNEITVLAGILRQARLWSRVEGSYTRLTTHNSDIPDALTREEGYRLIAVARAAREDAVAPYVALLSYATGMRSNEIKQLRLGSIHLDRECSEIRVRRESTKTNAGARPVALDKMGTWALRKLLARASRLGATNPEHYLLPTLLERHTRPSDPLSGRSGWDPSHALTSWDAEWNQVRKLAGIEHRRFHDLRHSYITRAAEAGVPLMVIQSQVGHLSESMTAHYTHVSGRSQHLAALQIEQHSGDLLRHLGLTPNAGGIHPPQVIFDTSYLRQSRKSSSDLSTDTPATEDWSAAVEEEGP